MSFLFSNLLWLLPLVAGPIIIHFLKKKSYIDVSFSSLKFFNIINSDTIKRNNLVNLLLLLLRTLIILVVIIILSRPIYKNSDHILTDNNLVVLFIDNSVSNYYNLKHNFNQLIKEFNESYPPSTIINLYYLGETELLYTGLLSEYNNENIVFNPSYNQIDVDNTIKIIDNYKESNPINTTLYFYSDFNDPLLNNALSNYLNDTRPFNAFLYKTSNDFNNLGITSLDLSNAIVIPNESITITANIKNNTNQDIYNKKLSLFTNSINVGTANLSIESQATESVAFKTSFSDFSNQNCYLELEKDAFLEDNKFFFNLSIPSSYNISVIYNDDNDIYFLSNVINALNQKYNNINVDYLLYSDYLSKDINEENTLFIIGYNNLTNSLINKISNFNIKTIITPGNNNSIKDLGIFFDDPTLNDLSILTLNGASFLSIEEEGIKDSFFNDYLVETEENRNIKVFNIVNIPNSPNTEVKLSNNSSLINKYTINNNIYYLLTVGMNLNDSNLPIKGLFIPFIFNLINNDFNIYYTSNTINSLKLSDYFKKNLTIASNNDKFTLQNKDIVNNDYLNRPNFYEISDNKKQLNVSMNINESEFSDVISFENIKEEFFTSNIFEDKKSLSLFLENELQGFELRLYFIYLLILLLITEMFLSNIYLNDKKK